MAHVPVIPAGADVVAAVDPPVPAPVQGPRSKFSSGGGLKKNA